MFKNNKILHISLLSRIKINYMINFLDDLMSNYNNSYHRSIKNSPNSINK